MPAKSRSTKTGLLIAGLLWFAACGSSEAAEIILRNTCQSASTMVRLGDVAEIYASDEEQVKILSAVELMPAPASGGRRFLRAREIQEILAARGLNLTDHRLSGSSQIEITRPAPAPHPLLSVTPDVGRKARDAVCAAIVAHLQNNASVKEPWDVAVDLTNDQVRALADGAFKATVQGGTAPWVGPQQFVITPQVPKANSFPLEARVSLPPMVVVAVRSIASGSIIQPGDVALQRSKSIQDGEDICDDLDQVVGNETTRSIGVGQFVDHDFICEPVLVHKGDAVTVYSRSSGLRVRTTGRARDDGSLGELISIESLLNRQAFFARVSGVHEVEIYARAVDARPPVPEVTAPEVAAPKVAAKPHAKPVSVQGGVQ
jgi:flagella basal body P-ring formation protein FlgA